MTDRTQSELRRIVRTHFSQRQSRSPAYSLRAFSRHLGLSPASVSLLLRGKAVITKKTARILASKLQLSEREATVIRKSLGNPTASSTSLEADFVQITDDELRVTADWFYFGILSLAETKDFRSEADWIARRLGIAIEDAEVAIDRLLRLNLIRKDSRGKLRVTGKSLRTSDGVIAPAVRKSHLQSLELARLSLEMDPIETRNFSAMTVAIDPEKLPEAAVRVRKFRRQLARFLESGKKTEVYRLSFQLFPLTHSSNS